MGKSFCPWKWKSNAHIQMFIWWNRNANDILPSFKFYISRFWSRRAISLCCVPIWPVLCIPKPPLYVRTVATQTVCLSAAEYINFIIVCRPRSHIAIAEYILFRNHTTITAPVTHNTKLVHPQFGLEITRRVQDLSAEKKKTIVTRSFQNIYSWKYYFHVSKLPICFYFFFLIRLMVYNARRRMEFSVNVVEINFCCCCLAQPPRRRINVFAYDLILCVQCQPGQWLF